MGETIGPVWPSRRGAVEGESSDMADPVRFGIVGAGMMGREHIRNLKLFDEACVVALADPHRDSIDRSLKTLGEAADGVGVFETTEAMLAGADLDAVMVVSPNFTHRAVLEPLFDAGVAILCEKPLCTSVADARWAAARAAAHPAVFWTGMEYRFMPPVARFVEELHAGAVGRLVMLSIREHRFPFLVKVGDWNRFSRNTGGTMVEKCCHFFDLMRLIVGSDAVSVYCSGAMDVNHLDERYGGERPDIIDNSYTVVEFANGVRAMLDLCMFAEGEEQQEAVAAVGDAAKLEVTIPSGELVLSPRVPLGAAKQTKRTHVDVDAAALRAGTHHGATYYQLAAFLDAVRGRGPVQVSAGDGLAAVIIGAAAELSAREGRVVRITELDPRTGD
jgi:predicted dehydrogenase